MDSTQPQQRFIDVEGNLKLHHDPKNCCDLGSSKLHGVISSNIRYSWKELKSFTNNFAEENLIGTTQFGKVYRGKIPQSSSMTKVCDVTVKIWNEEANLLNFYDDYTAVNDEEMFLTNTSASHHPNLVKLIGCCREGDLVGVVYDLNPLNTVQNLITKDSFTWAQRIKVALGFARLLEFLHSQEEYYVVQNIDAAHIVLDQEYNPRLFDFGLLHGGIFGKLCFPRTHVPMSFGYVDTAQLYHPDGWLRDVFAFGTLVLGLITKRHCVVDDEDFYVDEWAVEVYKPNDCLVHESLMQESGFDACDGSVITQLAMLCIDEMAEVRPTMAQVVKCLEGLFAVKKLGSSNLCFLEDENPSKRSKMSYE